MTSERKYGREDVEYATFYTKWSKDLALAHTLPELYRMQHTAAIALERAAKTHHNAVVRTASMSGQSQARAQARNVVSGTGEKARALGAAIEIHELFPEFGKPLIPAEQLPLMNRIYGFLWAADTPDARKLSAELATLLDDSGAAAPGPF